MTTLQPFNCQGFASEFDRWIYVFIYLQQIFVNYLFQLWGYVCVPAYGMSRHLSQWGTGDRHSSCRFLLKARLFPFHLILVFFFCHTFLLFSPFDYIASPQVCMATLIWENKYDCLSVAVSQTGRHKHLKLFCCINAAFSCHGRKMCLRCHRKEESLIV